MSLNYGTLRTEIATLAHRTVGGDIADDRLKTFVRQAEGEIARRCRAAEMLTRSSFVEGNRVTGGIYSLPTDWLEEGIIWDASDRPMTKVGLGEIRKYVATIDPTFFAPLSKTEIEFRGTPGTNVTLPYIYFARPTAFNLDADVNDLLTNHEDIYINYGLAKLYTFTQDLELAEGHAGAALDTIETLNEQAGRLLAGARAEGFYNLGTHSKGY